ncbi:MAG: hypothetical protein F9K29_03700 [Hyphomicrobiaceae bacterium]|nr:MAG: hypothetical protein F9K29_03700 [Hyphomicrobiaceae bacterium]
MTEAVPWFALAGLGAFHGLNPAMGWLFAVALGLNRRDRSIVWLAPLPIAFGHALSVGAVAGTFIMAGVVIDPDLVRIAAGLGLIGWAFYHWRYGHRHRVRFGMQAGLAGLAIWSFLMATAHGAGLMLWPALMPLCTSAAAQPAGAGPLTTALLGIGLHTLAMLVVTSLLAITIYEWVGLEILRRAWINIDLIWTFALVAAGGFLLFT